MWIYFLVTVVVIPSPILMMISSEAIAVVLALQGRSPLLIAVALAVGQSIGFSLLYYFGEQICERWQTLKNKLDQFDLKKFQKNIPYFIASAAFAGLPPLNLSCIAASALKVRFLPLLILIVIGRWSRYFLIASIPEWFQKYFNPDLLPSWLQL